MGQTTTLSGQNVSQQVGQTEVSHLQPTFGRYTEIPYDQMTPEQQEGYRSLVKAEGRLLMPKFLIAGLMVPAEGDADFRSSILLSGVRVVSSAPLRAGEIAYTLACRNSLALWVFIDRYLGLRATEREVDAFIALHVRRVQQRSSPPIRAARSGSDGGATTAPRSAVSRPGMARC